MSYAVYSSLVNKNAVITGGGNGTGAAIVEGFAKQDARITFLDITHAESEALTTLLGERVYPPIFRHCDLRDIDVLNATFSDIEADAGPIRMLVNSATSDDCHQIGTVTQTYWDNRIEVNLRHQFFCTQAVLLSMEKLGRGAILSPGSISRYLIQADLAIYMTAKAGVGDLTRDLACDLGGFGIHVNCIVPGVMHMLWQMMF